MLNRSEWLGVGATITFLEYLRRRKLRQWDLLSGDEQQFPSVPTSELVGESTQNVLVDRQVGGGIAAEVDGRDGVRFSKGMPHGFHGNSRG